MSHGQLKRNQPLNLELDNGLKEGLQTPKFKEPAHYELLHSLRLVWIICNINKRKWT